MHIYISCITYAVAACSPTILLSKQWHRDKITPINCLFVNISLGEHDKWISLCTLFLSCCQLLSRNRLQTQRAGDVSDRLRRPCTNGTIWLANPHDVSDGPDEIFFSLPWAELTSEARLNQICFFLSHVRFLWIINKIRYSFIIDLFALVKAQKSMWILFLCSLWALLLGILTGEFRIEPFLFILPGRKR